MNETVTSVYKNPAALGGLDNIIDRIRPMAVSRSMIPKPIDFGCPDLFMDDLGNAYSDFNQGSDYRNDIFYCAITSLGEAIWLMDTLNVSYKLNGKHKAFSNGNTVPLTFAQTIPKTDKGFVVRGGETIDLNLANGAAYEVQTAMTEVLGELENIGLLRVKSIIRIQVNGRRIPLGVIVGFDDGMYSYLKDVADTIEKRGW